MNIKSSFSSIFTLRQIGLSLVLCMVLSSCSSLRKADTRDYSPSKGTWTHTSSDSKSRNSSREAIALKPSRSKASKNSKPISGGKSEVRNQIASIAKVYQGTPYRYGGENPSGFDCSGFIQYVFNQAGIVIPRTSNQQSKLGKSKSWNQSSVGDIMVFGERNRISHVAIVCSVSSDGLKVIHSTSSRGVIVTDITKSDYWQDRLLYSRDVF